MRRDKVSAVEVDFIIAGMCKVRLPARAKLGDVAIGPMGLSSSLFREANVLQHVEQMSQSYHIRLLESRVEQC